jgi:hypothetical protein
MLHFAEVSFLYHLLKQFKLYHGRKVNKESKVKSKTELGNSYPHQLLPLKEEVFC